MKVIIDRAKWATGRWGAQTYLLDKPTGNMCCLGFVAKACGATDEQIGYLAGPSGASDVAWPDQLIVRSGTVTDDSKLAQALMRYNDAPGILDEVREQLVAEGLLKDGVEVEFVGEYPLDNGRRAAIF